jgi:hypothetical protein
MSSPHAHEPDAGCGPVVRPLVAPPTPMPMPSFAFPHAGWPDGVIIDTTRVLVFVGATKDFRTLASQLLLPDGKNRPAAARFVLATWAFVPMELMYRSRISDADPVELYPFRFNEVELARFSAAAVCQSQGPDADPPLAWATETVHGLVATDLTPLQRALGSRMQASDFIAARRQTKLQSADMGSGQTLVAHGHTTVTKAPTPDSAPNKKRRRGCAPATRQCPLFCMTCLFECVVGCVIGLAACIRMTVRWETWAIADDDTRLFVAYLSACASIACFFVAMGFSAAPTWILIGPCSYIPALLCLIVCHAPLPFYGILENNSRYSALRGDNRTFVNSTVYLHIVLLLAAGITETVVLAETVHVVSSGIALVFFMGHTFAWIALVVSTAFAKFEAT